MAMDFPALQPCGHMSSSSQGRGSPLIQQTRTGPSPCLEDAAAADMADRTTIGWSPASSMRERGQENLATAA
ncbi:hypothetical protein PpBr36_00725 [Pyricularia pennisetigena]|uniref:hypothetical protein n=1 Tax=Pyricularia pennisetigena TaxID=1578925 RepID=UPI001151DAD7|nr:hypothetical protein PpBr36_00725 [Pyricularia pennisetigena]TLS27940.1 hypothetical protein PpBr36_00725 [Pyricularia pennisetigena]